MFQFAIRNSPFVIVFSLALLTAWGCHKKASVADQSPPQVATAPPENSAPPAVTPPVLPSPKPAPLEPAPLPKTITPTSNLEVGEKNFQAGNYRQASRFFEAFLNANPRSKNRDLALFYLGLSRALPNDSSRDLHQAEVAFKRLITEFPNSQYRNQAEFILGLQAQIEKLKSDVKDRDERIKRLSDELQKLKDIDLQRRPSRPPE